MKVFKTIAILGFKIIEKFNLHKFKINKKKMVQLINSKEKINIMINNLSLKLDNIKYFPMYLIFFLSFACYNIFIIYNKPMLYTDYLLKFIFIWFSSSVLLLISVYFNREIKLTTKKEYYYLIFFLLFLICISTNQGGIFFKIFNFLSVLTFGNIILESWIGKLLKKYNKLIIFFWLGYLLYNLGGFISLNNDIIIVAFPFFFDGKIVGVITENNIVNCFKLLTVGFVIDSLGDKYVSLQRPIPGSPNLVMSGGVAEPVPYIQVRQNWNETTIKKGVFSSSITTIEGSSEIVLPAEDIEKLNTILQKDLKESSVQFSIPKA